MQVADSERLLKLLAALGVSPARTLEEADLAVLNGCVVRDTAEKRAWNQLALLRRWKRAGPGRLLGAIGCFAASEASAVEGLDFRVAPREYDRLEGLLTELLEKRRAEALQQRTLPKEQTLPTGSVKAFLPVIAGCNYRCTFCIVPEVRGEEVSAKVGDCLDAAKSLRDRGVREITLLGQNILSYGRDWSYTVKKEQGVLHHHPFAVLLAEMAEALPEARLRFLTSHPLDFSEELLKVMGEHSNVMPYLHLPAQSGDDQVLRAMKRGYTRAHYLHLVETIRENLPEVAISTDLIVGFPGETRAQFENTCRLVQEAHFEHAFTFRYSKRTGTKAADFPEQVAEGEKRARLKALNAIVDAVVLEQSAQLLGTVQEVLVEEVKEGKVVGKTRGNATVLAEGDAEPGELVAVCIEKTKHRRLEGRIQKELKEPLPPWGPRAPALH